MISAQGNLAREFAVRIIDVEQGPGPRRQIDLPVARLHPDVPVGGGPQPADGRLASDLTFDLVLNNDKSRVFTVMVRESTTAGNSSPEDLRQDVQGAIDQTIFFMAFSSTTI